MTRCKTGRFVFLVSFSTGCVRGLRCEALHTRWVQCDHLPDALPRELHPGVFSPTPELAHGAGILPTPETAPA